MNIYQYIDLLVGLLKWQIIPAISPYLLFQIVMWVFAAFIIAKFFIAKIGGGSE